MALAPRDANNYLDLATISLDHGSFQVGVDVVDARLQVLPDSAALYLDRGVLLVQMGRFDEANEDFEKAARLNPRRTSPPWLSGFPCCRKTSWRDLSKW